MSIVCLHWLQPQSNMINCHIRQKNICKPYQLHERIWWSVKIEIEVYIAKSFHTFTKHILQPKKKVLDDPLPVSTSLPASSHKQPEQDHHHLWAVPVPLLGRERCYHSPSPACPSSAQNGRKTAAIHTGSWSWHEIVPHQDFIQGDPPLSEHPTNKMYFSEVW